MPLLILRQLATDSLSLACYLKGMEPSVDQILASLFLEERKLDVHRPDYFYTSRRNKAFISNPGCKPSLRDIINYSISGIARLCLDYRGNHVVVKCELLERWQEVITLIPPLPLVSYAIYQQYGPPAYNRGDINHYLMEKIDPNAGRTAIPSPFIPQLSRLIEEEGLFETHIHLNGTTEADHVWLHAQIGRASCRERVCLYV